jgi:hypothetical protein
MHVGITLVRINADASPRATTVPTWIPAKNTNPDLKPSQFETQNLILRRVPRVRPSHRSRRPDAIGCRAESRAGSRRSAPLRPFSGRKSRFFSVQSTEQKNPVMTDT